MVFYTRKSVSVGLYTNYVQMRRDSLHYRATISSFSHSLTRLLPEPVISPGANASLKKIESNNFSQSTDSSQKLLNELNKKQKMMLAWPIVAVASAFIVFKGHSLAWPDWLLSISIITSLIITYITFRHDILAKTIVLLYDFDSEIEEAYRQLYNAAAKITDCAAVWRIEDKVGVHNQKYHAGAGSLINRKRILVDKATPSYVKCNVETISIKIGSQTLYFFPDRILIYNSNGISAVSYKELRVDARSSRFIEDEIPPRDAKIVDRTWKYVNISGGPDRRFKNNREIPICLYDEISLSSRTELNEVLQISQCDTAKALAEAISNLAKKTPREPGKLNNLFN